MLFSPPIGQWIFLLYVGLRVKNSKKTYNIYYRHIFCFILVCTVVHLICIMKHTHFILLLLVNMIYYDIIYALLTVTKVSICL